MKDCPHCKAHDWEFVGRGHAWLFCPEAEWDLYRCRKCGYELYLVNEQRELNNGTVQSST